MLRCEHRQKALPVLAGDSIRAATCGVLPRAALPWLSDNHVFSNEKEYGWAQQSNSTRLRHARLLDQAAIEAMSRFSDQAPTACS